MIGRIIPSRKLMFAIVLIALMVDIIDSPMYKLIAFGAHSSFFCMITAVGNFTILSTSLTDIQDITNYYLNANKSYPWYNH